MAATSHDEKARLAIVERENRELRKKLEQVEREHKDLKRAYFQLSLRQRNQGNEKDGGQDMFPLPREADEPDETQINTHVRNELVGPEWGSQVASTPNNIKGADDARSLVFRADFEGHMGAVYTAKFSRKGGFLASGSFDKSVRLWSWSWEDGTLAPRDTVALHEHSLNVSDVSWGYDDSFLVSGAYDRTVKWWDIAAHRAERSYELGGFVLAVACLPGDANLVWAASSQSSIMLFDRRTQAHVQMLSNEGGMVNGLDVTGCGNRLFTGDSKGQIRCWDRKWNKQDLAQVQGARPISDLHLIRASGAPEGGAGIEVGGVKGVGIGGGMWGGEAPIQSHHLAVNCYDNILRVYQRMAGPHTGMAGDVTSNNSISGANPGSAAPGAVDVRAGTSPLAMLSILESPEILSSTPSFHLQVSLSACSQAAHGLALSSPTLQRVARVHKAAGLDALALPHCACQPCSHALGRTCLVRHIGCVSDELCSAERQRVKGLGFRLCSAEKQRV
jgi:hypothetical protein